MVYTMAKRIRTYNGKIPPCHNYVDMDGWIDDKTVLENPHKGWYWHFIDNGVFRGEYRDKNVPGDYDLELFASAKDYFSL